MRRRASGGQKQQARASEAEHRSTPGSSELTACACTAHAVGREKGDWRGRGGSLGHSGVAADAAAWRAANGDECMARSPCGATGHRTHCSDRLRPQQIAHDRCSDGEHVQREQQAGEGSARTPARLLWRCLPALPDSPRASALPPLPVCAPSSPPVSASLPCAR